MAARSHMSMLFRQKSKVVSPGVAKNQNDVPADSTAASTLSKLPENAEKSATPPLVVQPSYTKLSEGLRKNTPASVICLAFCGGRKCRFDTSDRWTAEDMAVNGLYSHWITEDILAMARPNAQLIQKNDIVGQFIRLGIKTIINLQTAGEHSHCGPPLTSSGFSYLPESFMEKDIFYYNFGWKDYESGSLEGLLDAVKVLTFAVNQGKVAVHCHAGLGRTGVLLCCYLIYSQRLRSVEAIRHVRRKRPNTVQTSSQIMMIQEFEQFLINCFSVFSTSKADVKNSSAKHPFTLSHHLEDQKEVLHGYEARALRYIPKIIYVICERLLFLCRADPSPTLNFWLDESRPPFTRSFFCFLDDPKQLTYQVSGHERWDTLDDLRFKDGPNAPQMPVGQTNCGSFFSCDSTQVIFEEIVNSLLANPPTDLLAHPTVKDYCLTLDGRQSGWKKLSSERDPKILSRLLFYWLLHLKNPILTNEELSNIVVYADKPAICLSRFDLATRYTVEYLLRFIQRLCPTANNARFDLNRRLASLLTQQAVDIRGIYFPSDGRKRLGQGTLAQLLHFLNSAIELFVNEVVTISEESASSIQE
ncbi:protein tyrosine phosphatase domain-containing protein 1-like isoform X2 [Daphnia pulex]|uniref:protein tyrosine phosphatase domain-containing protein 1-like isoform X2 n=1 Tax=Daphnia pulex TaxID=6669 RepID=UPI001EDF8ECB|nr:protein tyrosine phosphatase domain-containing protein 1-like isoform X2 [Daphnia pulex]